MIYPKNSISKIWYQYSSGDENLVLEKFYNDPGDTVTPEAPCAGFDMEPTIVEGDQTKPNPDYGKQLKDDDLKKIFPYVTIEYYVCKAEKGEDGQTIYKYKKVVKTSSGDEVTWVVKSDATPFPINMWLDNMVMDGDEITVTEGDYKWKGVEFKYKEFSHKGFDDYKDMFIKSAQSDVIDAIMNGTSYEAARKALPWYTQEVGTKVSVNGELREIKETKVFDAGDSASAGILVQDALDKDKDAMVDAMVDKLNAMAQECANTLNETIVKPMYEDEVAVSNPIQYVKPNPFSNRNAKDNNPGDSEDVSNG